MLIKFDLKIQMSLKSCWWVGKLLKKIKNKIKLSHKQWPKHKDSAHCCCTKCPFAEEGLRIDVKLIPDLCSVLWLKPRGVKEKTKKKETEKIMLVNGRKMLNYANKSLSYNEQSILGSILVLLCSHQRLFTLRLRSIAKVY